jgi:hypothetical protein
VGARAGLDAVKKRKILQCRESKPGRPTQFFLFKIYLKVSSTCKRNYWVSPMRISTEQINYWLKILHPSDAGEEVGSTQAVNIFQEYM